MPTRYHSGVALTSTQQHIPQYVKRPHQSIKQHGQRKLRGPHSYIKQYRQSIAVVRKKRLFSLRMNPKHMDIRTTLIRFSRLYSSNNYKKDMETEGNREKVRRERGKGGKQCKYYIHIENSKKSI